MMRFLFFILFIAHFVLIKSESNFVFRHIDIVDGLSDNQIRGISLAKDGRIVIAGTSSLNLYNSATFENFYHDKKSVYKWNYNYQPKEYHDADGKIWMKGINELFVFDINSNSYLYDIESFSKKWNINGKLMNLFIDDSKNFWLLTDEKTLYLYDVNLERTIIVDEQFENEPFEVVQHKNLYWISYIDGTIRCWDYASKKFIHQENQFINKFNLKDYRFFMKPYNDGNLWIVYHNNLWFYESVEKQWNVITNLSDELDFFTCIDVDSKGNVWAGTARSGLRYVDSKDRKLHSLSGMELTSGGVLENDIFSVFIDEDDGLWVGTLFQGLCYYHPNMHKFKLKHVEDSNVRITNEIVRCFLENDDKTILIGTGKGLYKFYPQTNKIERVFNEIENLVLSLYKDTKGRIWVSTFFNGLYCIENGNVKHYYKEIETVSGRETVRSIFENNNGDFWISVYGGIGRFNPENGKISVLHKRFPQIEKYIVSFEFYPQNDSVFAVTSENGVFFYDEKNDSLWIPEIDFPENERFKHINTKYYSIYKDSRNIEWYATEYGLVIWDCVNKKRYTLSTDDGMTNNIISAVVEDNYGDMWVSTANGISKIELNNGNESLRFSILNYSTIDGLQSGKFYDRSALKSSDGTIYFGGVHGFNFFNPEQMSYEDNNHQPFFTSLSLFNNPVKVGIKYDGNTVLEKPLNISKKVVLKYNQNFITIDFAGLNYINPKQTYFRYKLEDFDQNWIEITTDGLGKAVYTGLPSGKYNLIVQTANSDKVWSENQANLIVIIKPPIWVTVYAKGFYLLILVFLILIFIRYLNKRYNKKILAEKEANERSQKEELEKLKMHFFTNISHELRTPLTLIITPLESLIKNYTDSVLKEKLTSIYNSANDLLNMVNQILDFRKLEMNQDNLNLIRGNFTQFVESLYIQFSDSMKNRDIEFILEKNNDELIAFYDQSKMQKVLNNLLSNALKFTPKGGIVILSLDEVKINEQRFFKVSVSDNGIGISSNDLEHIFDRYYQSKSADYVGSGIGLHIVKEYVELHNGKIEVKSELNKGTTFTFYIPSDLETVDYEEHTIVESEKSKKILVVEDNEQLRKFLVEELSLFYKVFEAPNGEVGERLAIEADPDLIISDFMMPIKDGAQLCKALKNNIDTSHIPFILLTAKNTDKAKIDGYDAGIDSFISKPFNLEVLLIRIKNLIEQQDKIKEHFHKTIEISPSSVATSSLDEELVKKVLLFVEQNMDNSNYSVDELSSDVGLSRSQLYRKLQSIVGLSPVEFIRSVRLKRSAQLLAKTQFNVSEIIDMVGMGSAKYFNGYFKDAFGVTPTQYRKDSNQQIDVLKI